MHHNSDASSRSVRRDASFWDFGSLYQKALRRQTDSCCGSGKAVSAKTLRRPCIRLLRQRQYLEMDQLASVVWWPASSIVGAVSRFSMSLFFFFISESTENRGDADPAHSQNRRRDSVLQHQAQRSRQSGVVGAPQIQS